MRKIRLIKRIIAMILVLVMGTSGALQTVSVYGAEEVGASVDSDSAGEEESGMAVEDNMSVTGTNGIGNLLADAIESEESEVEENTGFNVLSVNMTEGVATVELDVLGSSTLVVAIYDDDGKKFIASASKEVTREDKVITLTFDAEKIPQYYFIKAYLVETITYQPLSTVYENADHTSQMAAFYATTTDDFNADLVVNLDDDKTNNFLVYSENTHIIPTVSGLNELVSVDDETGTYLFKNVDSNITQLVEGDIFAYDYNDHLYIIKVGSISCTGTEATIVAADTSLEEVFQYIKIDTSKGVVETVPEESTGESEVESESAEGDSELASMEATEPVDVKGYADKFVDGYENLNDVKVGNLSLELEDGSISAALEGTYTCAYNGFIQLYFDYRSGLMFTAHLYLDYTLDFDVTLSASVTGNIVIVPIEIPIYKVLNITITASMPIKAEVALTFSGTLIGKVIYIINKTLYSHKSLNKSTMTQFEPKNFKHEGKISFGLEIAVGINVIDKKVTNIEGYVAFNIIIEGIAEYVKETDAGIHLCERCISGNVYGELTTGIRGAVFNNPDLSIETEAVLMTMPGFDFYYSFDKNELKLGTCPYYKCMVTFRVRDNDSPAAGMILEIIDVYNINGTPAIVKTDSDGKVVVELKKGGCYSIKVRKDNSTKYLKSTSLEVKNNENCWINVNGDMNLEESEPVSPEEGEEEEIPIEPVSEFEYTLLNDGTLEITSWSGNVSDLVIPSNVNGRTVTSIGALAFYNCDSLKYISIPETIAVIKTRAFSDCDGLESLNVPGTVVRMDWRVFEECGALEKVTINNGVGYLGDDTFFNCIALREVVLPNESVRCDSPFYGCSNLKNVKIEEGVTEISDTFFEGCDGLEKIDIPSSVNRIGESAFRDCHNLKDVKIPSSVFGIGACAFAGCTKLEKINIPASVIWIDKSAFSGCESLVKIAMPSSLKTIGDYAFSYCSNLKEVEMAASVVSIGNYAFRECDSLVSVNVPSSVTTIGDGAFMHCDNLLSISIPASIVTIGESVFKNCVKLKDVTLDNGLKTISREMFMGCVALEKIVIPSSVSIINGHAFEDCESLSNVDMGMLVLTIGSYAFANCDSLKGITIAPTVEVISGGAFSDCDNLIEIDIPSSVKYIGNSVFWECDKLTKVVMGNGVEEIGSTCFENCSSLEQVVLSTSLSTINRAAFRHCVSLKTIEIPLNVTSIGSSIFDDCPNLIKITIHCAPDILEVKKVLDFEGRSSALEVIYVTSEELVLENDNMQVEEQTLELENIVKENNVENVVGVTLTKTTSIEELDIYTNTVTYTNLTPGKIYNFYIFKTEDVDNVFADGNLLHIEQAVADENGQLMLLYTLNDIYTDVVLRLVGYNKVDIADTYMAEVKGWKYTGYESTPYIGIAYNGHELVQGRDYQLSGDVVAPGMGIYNITVTGDGAFTGEKTFKYIVTGDCVFGDSNSDNMVDIRDAVQMKKRIAGMEVDMNTYAADVNADTEIDVKDAVKVMKYIAGYTDVVLGEAS